MADDTLEAYVRQVIESQQSSHVTIAWQGGEPTLIGLDFFRRASMLARKYLRRRATLEQTIQTNAVLIDDEWCEFLRENAFLVGLSMDGPQAMHDAYRVDKSGAPTFFQVMRAVRLMQKHNVEFNVLCTVHDANVRHAVEIYRFFRDEVKTQFVQFIPIVERSTKEPLDITNGGWGEQNHRRPRYTQDGSLVTERSVKPKDWGEFLIGAFDEWVTHDVGKVFVQLFKSALASWLGLPASLCIFSETCENALALEHNGDLYSCDHFVEPCFRLGNQEATYAATDRIGPAAGLRRGQARHSSPLLPRMRSTICLQWGVPAQPLYLYAGWRGGPELSLCRTQGLFPAHRWSDDVDGRFAPRR